VYSRSRIDIVHIVVVAVEDALEVYGRLARCMFHAVEGGDDGRRRLRDNGRMAALHLAEYVFVGAKVVVLVVDHGRLRRREGGVEEGVAVVKVFVGEVGIVASERSGDRRRAQGMGVEVARGVELLVCGLREGATVRCRSPGLELRLCDRSTSGA
jgi:hypothetical protein